MSNKPILQVALPLPVNSLFDYEWSQIDNVPPIGARVKVPVKNKEFIGIVMGHATSSKFTKLKQASAIDADQLISSPILELCRFASKYYHRPIGDVVFSAIPKFLRAGKIAKHSISETISLTVKGQALNIEELKGTKQKKLLSILQQDINIPKKSLSKHAITSSTLKSMINDDFINVIEQDTVYYPLTKETIPFHTLNQEQKGVFDTINSDLNSFLPYLLYGVTGSGKTEVYMHVIKEVLKFDKQVLILIPEIGLTPQTLSRFLEKFKVHIALIHSELTDTQKLDSWLDASSGKAKLIIGTRSALFTPIPNLGLIIIDEEHDQSFKQLEKFRYHARDLAVFRAMKANVPIILGTATPSIESMYNVVQKRFKFLELSIRAGKASMPTYKILDMRNTKNDLSAELLTEIKSHLENKSQVLLFLNRRGFAPLLYCQGCGWSVPCKNCDSFMTFHNELNKLVCHHCNHRALPMKKCPKCRLSNLKPMGIGTEKLAHILTEHFPDIPIVRVDRDTTAKKGSLQTYLKQIESQEPMILIGTQMLAKGHHFPNVTLVGILGADSGLYSSDYHSIERLGQLITQVAGRAGRAHKIGTVLIQTLKPDHPTLQTLVTKNYLQFLDEELNNRKITELPPFSSHTLFIAESNEQQKSIKLLHEIKKLLLQHNDIQCLGPIPAVNERRAGKFRSHLLLQGGSKKHLQSILVKSMPAIHRLKFDYQTRWIIDVDPIDLL